MSAQPTAETDTAPGAASPCRVFGIVRSAVGLPDWDDDDVAARDIRLVRHGEVAALVERLEPAQRAGRRDVLAHSAVLNAVAAQGEPVVPVRFGSVVPSEQAVVNDLLAPREDHWQTMVDAMRGRSQFTLRAAYEQERLLTEIVIEDSRIAELRELTTDQSEDVSYSDRVRLGELVAAAVQQKRSVDIETVVAALTPHCQEQQVSPGSGLDTVADFAFLVAEDHRARFEREAERLAERLHGRIALRLLGPLAPFDFVTGT